MPYLDHAATTPLCDEARAAMVEQLDLLGNASSLHSAGRRARRTVEECRESLAYELGARPGEVIFTAGGTESDNIALKGLYWARHAEDPRRRRVLVSAVEHHAVLDPAEWLAAHEGAELTLLPVDGYGRVDPAQLRAELAADPGSVAVVSVMWANNEIGTLQPVAALAEVCHEFGVPFHCDAVQAVATQPVDFAGVGADALSVTAHKIGGPVGTGALLLRRGLAAAPLTHGGGQERDVRSGTLNVPGIAGFAAAASATVRERKEHAERLAELHAQLVAGLVAAVPDLVVNGDPDPAGRLPGLVHVSVPGCEGDSLLLLLDARGIECSTGSACTAGVSRPSHVVLATGAGEQLARGSLRLSLGRTSCPSDVAAVVGEIGPVVQRARRAGILARP